MLGRSLPFSFRNILDRVGLAPTQQRSGRDSGMHLRRWQRMIAALEDWWTASYHTWRSEIPSGNHAERLCRFCRDCGEDTPHEGFDEYGVGWYAQIYRCQFCGEQGMRIWPLA